MACGGYLSCIHKHWLLYSFLLVWVYCFVMNMVFWLYVRYLVRVRLLILFRSFWMLTACYIFFYLATWTKKYIIVKNQNWRMGGREEKNESIIAEWNLNRKRSQIFQGFSLFKKCEPFFTTELPTCIIHKAKKSPSP